MRKTAIILLLCLVMTAGGCDRRSPQDTFSGTESVSSGTEPPEASEPETTDANIWTAGESTPPEPFTRVPVDGAALRFDTVEADFEVLFSLPEGDYSPWAEPHMIDGNLVINNQQRDVLVFDLAGRKLAAIPCRGMTVHCSAKHFAVADYEDDITFYDKNGEVFAAVPYGRFAGNVQSLVITADGGEAFLTVDRMEDGAYAAYRLALPDGSPETLDTSALPENVALGFSISGITGGYVVFTASRSDGGEHFTEALAFYDIAGKAFAYVEYLEETLEGDMPVRQAAKLSPSGALYTIEDERTLPMLQPMMPAFGDELNFLDPYGGTGSCFAQYFPLTGRGRAGYFPLYSYTAAGMNTQDSVILCTFDAGSYKVGRATLGDRMIDPPVAGINLSTAVLESLCGQQLSHRSFGKGSLYGFVSAIVTTYTDRFSEIGYLLDSGKPELPDELVTYVLYNYYHSYRDRRDAFYNESTYEYVIPKDVVEEWVAESFALDEMPDLIKSSSYDPARDSFIIPMGGGMGETDTVYLEEAAYADGLLELDIAVLPPSYRIEGEPLDPHRLHMSVRCDTDGETWRYENVTVS